MTDANSGKCLDVRKFYETLAKIISDREGVEIKVVAVREREAAEINNLIDKHTA